MFGITIPNMLYINVGMCNVYRLRHPEQRGNADQEAREHVGEVPQHGGVQKLHEPDVLRRRLGT